MTELPFNTTDSLAEATAELIELLDELRSGEVLEDGLYTDEFPST